MSMSDARFPSRETERKAFVNRVVEHVANLPGVDSAASMLRFSLTALDSNKPISLRVAHFAQFKAGRLRNIRVLVDSLDLVEQALGRPIHLPRMTSHA